ncbi:MAG: tetraacyldisaccharide 4'-kinase [Candidatus Zixiibacteriota bacterium]
MKRLLRDTFLTWTGRHQRPDELLGIGPRLFGAAAWPLSWVYRAGVGLDWTFKPRKPFPAHSRQRIAVIASPLVGGVGKSPLVAQLARRARESGQRVAIVTRGYAAERPTSSPVRVRADGGNIEQVGDEAVMLAQQCGAPVTVARYPELAIEELGTCDGFDLILLDDGVSRRWEGEHRILVFAATDLDLPVRYLPSGRWRIPPHFALPAHGIAVIGTLDDVSEAKRQAQAQRLASWGMDLPTGWYAVHASGFALLEESGLLKTAVPPQAATVAFCGLGQPARFEESLRAAGITPSAIQRYPDHHAYCEADIAQLIEVAKGSGASWLVTTHKDAVKIRPEWLRGVPLYILRISLELTHGADMLSVILELPE